MSYVISNQTYDRLTGLRGIRVHPLPDLLFNIDLDAIATFEAAVLSVDSEVLATIRRGNIVLRMLRRTDGINSYTLRRAYWLAGKRNWHNVSKKFGSLGYPIIFDPKTHLYHIKESDLPIIELMSRLVV